MRGADIRLILTLVNEEEHFDPHSQRVAMVLLGIFDDGSFNF